MVQSARSHHRRELDPGRVTPPPVSRQAALQLNVGVEAEPLPMNPNEVDARAASEPFQDMFVTVTEDPDVVRFPLQSWVML